MSVISKKSSILTRFTRADLHAARQDVDLQIIASWIPEKSSVLDLGCGRGWLLEQLVNNKQVTGVGVDSNPVKIRHAVGLGINVYQGDLTSFMQQFPAGFFDQVVLSRTLQDLSEPHKIIDEALRVGRHLIVGFVNYGYWRNRLHLALHGSRIVNTVFPDPWYQSEVMNPITIQGFEEFCHKQQYKILQRVCLKGDWKHSATFFPNLVAGYGLYQITRA
jgi:methionine biosynthesis protein MetW